MPGRLRNTCGKRCALLSAAAGAERSQRQQGQSARGRLRHGRLRHHPRQGVYVGGNQILVPILRALECHRRLEALGVIRNRLDSRIISHCGIQARINRDIKAYKETTHAHNPRFLWETSYNCVYDLEAKTLRLTTCEEWDTYNDFKL